MQFKFFQSLNWIQKKKKRKSLLYFLSVESYISDLSFLFNDIIFYIIVKQCIRFIIVDTLFPI